MSSVSTWFMLHEPYLKKLTFRSTKQSGPSMKSLRLRCVILHEPSFPTVVPSRSMQPIWSSPSEKSRLGGDNQSVFSFKFHPCSPYFVFSSHLDTVQFSRGIFNRIGVFTKVFDSRFGFSYSVHAINQFVSWVLNRTLQVWSQLLPLYWNGNPAKKHWLEAMAFEFAVFANSIPVLSDVHLTDV